MTRSMKRRLDEMEDTIRPDEIDFSMMEDDEFYVYFAGECESWRQKLRALEEADFDTLMEKWERETPELVELAHELRARPDPVDVPAIRDIGRAGLDSDRR